ncbi:MAG: amidohydrolase [Thermoleophilia bacterium]
MGVSMPRVDTVLCRAKVLALDGRSSIHQAVALGGDRILAVGSNDAIMALAGRGTRVIELAGCTVLPGINDAHLHAVAYGGTRPPLALGLHYPGTDSIADVVRAVREAVAANPPGRWIRGFGWDAANLRECREDPGRLPRRWDIDPVSPDHPVVLTDQSLHTTLANSRALELAGVSRDTPDPPSGEMERDADGQPTGIFKELQAIGLIARAVPALTRDEKRRALLSTLDDLSRNGVTSYTDAGLGSGGDGYFGGLMAADILDIYAELAGQGELAARVTALLLFGTYGGLSVADLKRGLAEFQTHTHADPTGFRIPGIKVFADGIPITKTSYMWEPYLGGGHGVLSLPGDGEADQAAHLIELIGLVHRAGYQAVVHATGDRATDLAVDGFARAMAEDPRPDPRHYVVHGEFIRSATARRMAALGVGVSMQPAIQPLIADIEPMIVGPERAAYEWPFRTVVEAGVNLTSSSDMPVTGPRWQAGVEAMVLRTALSGRVSGPEERIGLFDALRSYTVNGAWQDQMESVKGTLEPGKLADLCVLVGDIVEVDPHEIHGMDVLMTIVGGRIVHDRF